MEKLLALVLLGLTFNLFGCAGGGGGPNTMSSNPNPPLQPGQYPHSGQQNAAQTAARMTP